MFSLEYSDYCITLLYVIYNVTINFFFFLSMGMVFIFFQGLQVLSSVTQIGLWTINLAVRVPS